MNKVVKAENEKIAAIDYASARETVADGEKRAKIKVLDYANMPKIVSTQMETK
jgi:hypothetical protein